jgi:predicted signal transduction protein with EAL and GGDEF domain
LLKAIAKLMTVLRSLDPLHVMTNVVLRGRNTLSHLISPVGPEIGGAKCLLGISGDAMGTWREDLRTGSRSLGRSRCNGGLVHTCVPVSPSGASWQFAMKKRQGPWLNDCVAPNTHLSDALFAMRICSGEFATLLPRQSTPGDAQTIALEAHSSFPAQLFQDDPRIRPSARVGVGEYPPDDENTVGVMQAALDARRTAKQIGGGVMRIYDDSMRNTEMGLLRVIPDTISFDALVSLYKPPHTIAAHSVAGQRPCAPAHNDNDASSNGAEPDPFPRHVDAAPCRTKAAAWGQYKLNGPKLQTPVHAKRPLKLDLPATLSVRNLCLYYAPKVNPRTGRANGLAGRLPWRDPERGSLNRAASMHLIAKMGLIGDVNSWELHQVCFDAATWPEEVNVALQVTATQMKDGALLAAVVSALTASGLLASRLELEISNSLPMDSEEHTLSALRELRNTGVRIGLGGIDLRRFALANLIGFPFDKINMDGILIRRLAGFRENNPGTLELAREITALCTSLDVACAADGVETEKQYSMLTSEDYTRVRGRIFGELIPAHDVHANCAE